MTPLAKGLISKRQGPFTGKSPTFLLGVTGLARGRKRNRSLFELMDPKGAYRAPSLSDPQEEAPEEPEPAIEEIEKEVAAEPAVEDKKEPSSEEAQPEAAIEPFLATNDGQVRLVMNYPLAVMLCFAAVILLICAALVGWRLGRDSALKGMGRAPTEMRQELPY